MTTLRLGLAAALTVSILGFASGCSSHHDDGADAYNADGTGSSDPYRPSDEAGTTPTTAPTGTGTTTKPAADAGTTADASADGSTGPGTSGGVACLDDSTPAAQPACPGDGDCQFACDNFASDYKKGLSADIRKCLTDATCTGNTSVCSTAALAKACADPTATTFCTPMVNGCKTSNASDSITQSACETLVKGLTTTGRANLQSCFETDNDCGGCLIKMY